MIIFIQARGSGTAVLWMTSRWKLILIKSSGVEGEAQPQQELGAQRKG
jgi:hypothetical protein